MTSDLDATTGRTGVSLDRRPADRPARSRHGSRSAGRRIPWPSVRRYVLAGTVGAFFWFFDLLIRQSTGPIDALASTFVVIDLLVGLACLVLVAWRRRRPAAVAAALGLASGVSAFSIGPWLLATVSLATRRRWSDVVLVEVTTLLGTWAYDLWHPQSEPASIWFTLLFTTILVGAVTAFGWYVGARRDLVESLRERAETAEREKLAFLETARIHERAAIAREMHDVLAHRISLVAMHAGALAFRPDLEAEERERIVRTIEANAQLALTDLRDVLGVLRDPSALADRPAPPQPTLDDLGALVAETVEAGTPVVHVADVDGTPPTTLGRHAFRVAQEALTNARKHAPGLSVTLTVRGGAGRGLVVEAVNPTPLRPVPRVTGAGAGLTGMAERAALAGGTLTHGRTRDGTYRVCASFPWPATGGAAPPGGPATLEPAPTDKEHP